MPVVPFCRDIAEKHFHLFRLLLLFYNVHGENDIPVTFSK